MEAVQILLKCILLWKGNVRLFLKLTTKEITQSLIASYVNEKNLITSLEAFKNTLFNDNHVLLVIIRDPIIAIFCFYLFTISSVEGM